MNQDWSIVESDWQGVDDEPITGSDNLVKSGGVYEHVRQNIVSKTSGKTIGEILTIGADSVPEIDITSIATKKEGYGYNSNLQLIVRVSAYDAYELDVATLALCKVSFYAYGYCGILMKDGSLYEVNERLDYYNKQTIIIPNGAKYLRITMANTLGTQKITKERVSMRDYNTLNENINELNTLLPTDIDRFNNVKKNRDGISLFLSLYNDKAVDKTNRLVVSFNGDSIIGSQLDNITKSDEYLTGAFPPNMSKMIMARQFLDDYQFDNADVVYRNVIHSDWVKSSGAFGISNGKDEPSKTFNEIEVYGTANIGDSAEITVTGYKYFKLIWSEYTNTSKFQVLCSINGAAYTPWGNSNVLPEYIEVTDASRCMQKYAVLELNAANTYKFKIIATENPNNILFWGCEMWNNPRLDVVVEAFSGSRAISQVNSGQLEAYHSDWHTPALVVSDILSLNDYSFIVGSNETLDDWMSGNMAIFNRVKDNNIGLLLFSPTENGNFLVKSAKCLAIQNGIPLIDMREKLSVIPPSSSIKGPDGLHLSDYGNTYFYDELKRVLNEG